MSFDVEVVRQLVESIWDSLLGLPVESDNVFELPPGNEGFLTGCVQFTGAWEGALTLTCAEAVARQAASVLFGVAPASADAEQVRDVLGELANMTGGNLKAYLPSGCFLSLPAVANGQDYALRILDARVVLRTGFRCQGQPFVVAVHERRASPCMRTCGGVATAAAHR